MLSNNLHFILLKFFDMEHSKFITENFSYSTRSDPHTCEIAGVGGGSKTDILSNLIL